MFLGWMSIDGLLVNWLHEVLQWFCYWNYRTGWVAVRWGIAMRTPPAIAIGIAVRTPPAIAIRIIVSIPGIAGGIAVRTDLVCQLIAGVVALRWGHLVLQWGHHLVPFSPQSGRCSVVEDYITVCMSKGSCCPESHCVNGPGSVSYTHLTLPTIYSV